jgi:hypothetical protein
VRTLAVILALAGPLTASYLVSGAGLDQAAPTATATDYGFVVAWQDNRDLPRDRAAHIYACRLDASGRVIDTAGLRVSYDTLEDFLPAVASDGTGCFAVWHRGC